MLGEKSGLKIIDIRTPEEQSRADYSVWYLDRWGDLTEEREPDTDTEVRAEGMYCGSMDDWRDSIERRAAAKREE